MNWKIFVLAMALGSLSTSSQLTRQIPASQISLSYLGAAGWQITDGQTTILVDPYLSRIRRAVSAGSGSAAADLPDDTRPIIGPDDPLVSDVTTIDAHIKQADVILVTHSHFDHVMDVPFPIYGNCVGLR